MGVSASLHARISTINALQQVQQQGQQQRRTQRSESSESCSAHTHIQPAPSVAEDQYMSGTLHKHACTATFALQRAHTLLRAAALCSAVR